MNPIHDNLAAIRDRIDAAALRAGRAPGAVKLLAVSKTRSPEEIERAITAGQTRFGENRVQEAQGKIPEIDGEGLEWRLIGPLQRNKVKYAVKLFTMVESVDSLRLAEELNKRWPGEAPLAILAQVNIGREPQKHGFSPEEAPAAIRALAAMSNLSVRGLMTIPPAVADPEEARPFFRGLRELAARIGDENIPGVSMAELSMGMSHDFETAIEEGATTVRVGSAIFGPRRPYQTT